HNLAYALERLDRLDEAETAYADAAARAREEPRVQLGWGIIALKRGDHVQALERLQRGRELLGQRPVPAVWFWATSLAHAAADRPEAAREIARAGVEAHPGSAILKNALAVL